jgi:hypothetical protein
MPTFPKPQKKSKRLANRARRKGEGQKAWQRRAMTKLYLNFVRPAYLHGLAAGQGRRGKPALCERCYSKLATELHHVAGRSGDALVDSEFFSGLCWKCHEHVHAHPAEARAEGWLESKYSRTPEASKFSATEVLEEFDDVGEAEAATEDGDNE